MFFNASWYAHGFVLWRMDLRNMRNITRIESVDGLGIYTAFAIFAIFAWGLPEEEKKVYEDMAKEKNDEYLEQLEDFFNFATSCLHANF